MMNRCHTEQVDDTPRIVRNEPALWLSKLPTVDSSSNKYTRGHALIFGGYPMTGPPDSPLVRAHEWVRD
ncbi:MAG: hypothetical protein EBQ75_08810 [Actinobacteria bacterium]|nr:hypothetical protein [Actinomycetota bacterium]